MIVYEGTHLWGLPLLWRTYGSAFPRAALFAAISAGVTAILYKLGNVEAKSSIKNPTLFQIFGFTVGFAVVFRSSLSYNRFWEARTMLQTMMGRLSYFTIETLAADVCSMNPETATPAEKKAAYRFFTDLIHLVSLLFAMKVKYLRHDNDLSTVYEHRMSGKAPAMCADAVAGRRTRFLVFLFNLLSVDDMLGIEHPQQESAVPIIGGLREGERERLCDLVPTAEMKGLGKTINGTRPYAVFAMINALYIRRIAEGGLKTHAPLVARLGGIAEEGMAAFGHCAKLKGTQFPFPWAQVVMALLAIMAMLLPFIVVAFVSELWMGVVLSFVIVLTYWSLNEVACEMEDPFGTDPNDLPLARYAFDFNQGLLSATHQFRPAFFDEVEAEERAAVAGGRSRPPSAGGPPALASSASAGGSSSGSTAPLVAGATATVWSVPLPSRQENSSGVSRKGAVLPVNT